MRAVLATDAATVGPLRKTVAVVSALVLAVGFAVVAIVTPAEAVSPTQFQRGEIISDANFYDGSAMTAPEIQAFLDTRIGPCPDGGCLNKLTFTVASHAADYSSRTGELLCDTFTGGTGLSAATIIYRTQVACGISAKVILVTLQKEQGLLSPGRVASDWALSAAMGWGCPDTAPCSAEGAGFSTQVYWGTMQLKIYKASRWGTYQPGNTYAVRYSPNASCGTINVYIKNYATAALYNYTPYTPTTAALNAFPGAATGEDAFCGSYGNRNFWFYYYNWFGSPTDIRPQGVDVTRISGADRYEVSAGVSAGSFEPGVPVVYVTSGRLFADALSAGPAAAKEGGPVLLVDTDLIPAFVRTEIVRLTPARIVVVGGPSSVSDGVFQELSTLAPEISRVGGIDRYEVSRSLALQTFGDAGASVAYLATGATYADALSASAAAGSIGAPVVLVKGTEPALDDATRETLLQLGVSKVLIAGGPASVSPGIETALGTLPGVTVTRFGGADRYEVSIGVNADAFDAAETIYVASGAVFPDALSGSPVAGMSHSPLYVIQSKCIPRGVLEHLLESGASKMVILGGSATLTSAVESFANCH